MDDPTVIPISDVISDEDFMAYMAVVRDALLIHYDREQVRKGLWKEYEAKDQANSIKVKVDRIVRSFEVLEREEDPVARGVIRDAIREEFLDIINYANFGARQS